jgi:hypothetical protein
MVVAERLMVVMVVVRVGRLRFFVAKNGGNAKGGGETNCETNEDKPNHKRHIDHRHTDDK